MAVKIRLKRIGRTNRPFYRVCVFDGRTRRDGAPIEELGSYDPHARALGNKVELNAERAAYWLSVGAQPSETVASFLRGLGIDKNGQDPAVAERVKAEAEASDERAAPSSAPKQQESATESAKSEDAPAEAPEALAGGESESAAGGGDEPAAAAEESDTDKQEG